MANCIVLADCEEKSSTWEKKLELAAEPRDEQKQIWGEREKNGPTLKLGPSCTSAPCKGYQLQAKFIITDPDSRLRHVNNYGVNSKD